MYLVLIQVESGDGAVVVDREADVMIVNPGADIVPESSSMATQAWCGELDLGDDPESVMNLIAVYTETYL